MGSRAERVTSLEYLTSANADMCIRYQPTANGKTSMITLGRFQLKCLSVLDHAENEINVLRGGITTMNGGRKHARIILLAGAGKFAPP